MCLLRAVIARSADRHARDLVPVVEDIRSCGATSLRAIAAELNARGMLRRRGGRWHVSTVLNLLDRSGSRRTLHRGDAMLPPELAAPGIRLAALVARHARQA